MTHLQTILFSSSRRVELLIQRAIDNNVAVSMALGGISIESNSIVVTGPT